MSTSMNTLGRSGLTVAQLAIAHPGALGVFTKYNIDYCCGGSRSLEEACYGIGLDPVQIRAEVFETTSADGTLAARPDTWRSGFLADFIVQNHHSFVRNATPELEALLEKVCYRHGNDSLELPKIRELFLELSEELANHMEKEERVLFPLIKSLESQILGPDSLERMIGGPISVLEDEHEAAGDLIKQIRYLSNNYTPPDYACPTFQITYQKLKEFDNDLMRHVHLENNILFERFKKQSTGTSCSI